MGKPDAHARVSEQSYFTWWYLCLSDGNLSTNMATVLGVGSMKTFVFLGDVSDWEVFVCVLYGDNLEGTL